MSDPKSAVNGSPDPPRIPRQAWWLFACALTAVLLWTAGITIALIAPPPAPSFSAILREMAVAATIATILLGLSYYRGRQDAEREARDEERHRAAMDRTGQVAAEAVVWYMRKSRAAPEGADDPGTRTPIGLDPEVLEITRRLNRRLTGDDSLGGCTRAGRN